MYVAVCVCVAREGAGRRMLSEILRSSVQGRTEKDYRRPIYFKNILNEFHQVYLNQVLILAGWESEPLGHLKIIA